MPECCENVCKPKKGQNINILWKFQVFKFIVKRIIAKKKKNDNKETVKKKKKIKNWSPQCTN